MEKPKQEWILKSIKIEFCHYGENKGKYQGVIQFQEGMDYSNDNFSFNLRDDQCQEYLALVSKEVVRSASQLSDNLLKQLKLKPDA